MKRRIDDIFKAKNITGVSFDSREVKSGDAFFAIKGEKSDGNDYIEFAFEKGAVVVFTDNPENSNQNIEYLEDIRLGLALAAGIIYPKIPANIIAVTGTNGKSSVVSYIHQMLSKLNKQSACIGTLGIESSKKGIDKDLNSKCLGMTTADPVNFRKILNTLAQNDIDNVALEASSHGLLQKRLGDIKASGAAFVSFSQDHLEYHKTMQEYLNAKLILFKDNLAEKASVVINSEMMFFDFTKNFFIDNNISFCSVGNNGDLKITENKRSIEGQQVTFEYNGQIYKFSTNIIGSFQVSNMLIAAKLVNNLGVELSEIVKILPEISSVTGRLQRVTDIDAKYQVFVDYAHTPEALQKSLEELRALKSKYGNLYVVFGCGGDRDASKRPIMGKIASEIADKVIVTDDNPRTEDARSIRMQVIGNTYGAMEVQDRKKAIADTISKLEKDDILLVAGKGHENYQIIGKDKIAFSDIDIAKKCINKS